MRYFSALLTSFVSGSSFSSSEDDEVIVSSIDDMLLDKSENVRHDELMTAPCAFDWGAFGSGKGASGKKFVLLVVEFGFGSGCGEFNGDALPWGV